MVTVVSALNRIARQVSLESPTSWVSATETEHVEIRDDFFLETVADIQDRVDLPSPIGKQTTVTGTGAETYSLPTDFLRVQRDPMAVYETTTVRRRCYPVTNDGDWTHIKQIGSTGGDRYYKIAGYDENFSISLYREPSSSISVTVSYMSDNWKADNTGTVGSAFTAEEDVLLLPRRVVEAGAVARWRERKGLNPSDKWREYNQLLTRLINDARGIRSVRFGDPAGPRMPWDIPVPDEIPTS